MHPVFMGICQLSFIQTSARGNRCRHAPFDRVGLVKAKIGKCKSYFTCVRRNRLLLTNESRASHSHENLPPTQNWSNLCHFSKVSWDSIEKKTEESQSLARSQIDDEAREFSDPTWLELRRLLKGHESFFTRTVDGVARELIDRHEADLCS